MSHNVELDPGSGGATIVTVDLSLNTYPTTGELPASCLYVSANSTTAPTPVTDTHPLPTKIVDGSGNQITSFGGGTQYTEGDTDSTITGTAAMWEDSGDTLRAVGMAKPLPIQPGTSVTFPVTDNGGSLTVDGSVSVSGTVTVGSHDVTNAGTFAVQASQSGTWNITNVSGTVSLPTGASTSAKQDTGNTSLASIDGKVPALGQALAAASVPVVLTAAQLTSLANADLYVGGTIVSNSNAVPISDAGGSLTVDGTVSVSGHVPGTSATSLGKAEDAAAADGDTGVMMLAVRKDTAATTVGADGDYHPLEVDANGNLWVMAKLAASQTLNTVTTVGTVTTITNVVHVDDNSGSLTVDAPVGTPVFVRLSDGSSAISTLPVSLAAGAAAIGKAEDVASADADVGVPAMAVRKATPANTSGTDGDYEMLQMSAGRLWVSAALEAGANAIGKLAANSGVTIGAVEIAAAQTLATVTTVTTVSTVTAVSDAQVQGKAAEDAALSGNPVRQGVRASAAVPSAMSTDGDVVTPWADLSGRQVVREQCGTGTLTQVSDTATSTTLLSANTARKGCSIQNDSSATLYIKTGTTASATDYTARLVQYAYWESPYGFTGRIDGIWATDPNDGAARITEYT